MNLKFVQTIMFIVYLYLILRFWCDLNRSGEVTGELNNVDYLITVVSVKGWDILGSK